MHARSALFDLYGDHLRARGGTAPISALIALLAPLGIAAPAVRTAVSRMTRQGWLSATRLGGQRGYELTAQAVHRLDAASSRIYRTHRRVWNGELDLLVFDMVADRRRRATLTRQLQWHSYGQLCTGTWISPWPSNELDEIFGAAGIGYHRFRARHSGDTRSLIRQAWDLDALAAAYRDFMVEMDPVVGLLGGGNGDEGAYTARFRLVHAFRAFLFTDPGLPPELLPDTWPGSRAAAFFDAYAARLRPAADRFVDNCLQSR